MTQGILGYSLKKSGCFSYVFTWGPLFKECGACGGGGGHVKNEIDLAGAPHILQIVSSASEGVTLE